MKLTVRLALLAWLASAAAPLAGSAQTAGVAQGFTVTGMVTDGQLGSRVDGVRVSVNSIVRTWTDSAGIFMLTGVDFGTNIFDLRRIGYESIAFDVWVDSVLGPLAVTMAPLSVRLRDLTVVTDQPRLHPMFGFDMRRQEGNGRFLTRNEIEDRTPVRFSDILRGMPGLRVTPDPHYFGNTVTATRTGGGRDVRAALVPGRMLMDQTVRLDNVVNWRYVEGVEVYVGPAQIPPRFNVTSSACAVIVVWTR
ncbi:MAG: hypothetical protein O7I93_01990 [Gemmatimonadetes bacterium]|nr:hypothetical protein [Gemmatimonadota bacterium]